MNDNETSDTALAKAVEHLSEAIWASTEKDNRVTLTLGTPSTGGELTLKFDPTSDMKAFFAILTPLMEKVEEANKAKIELNAKLGIGVKAAK